MSNNHVINMVETFGNSITAYSWTDSTLFAFIYICYPLLSMKYEKYLKLDNVRIGRKPIKFKYT